MRLIATLLLCLPLLAEDDPQASFQKRWDGLSKKDAQERMARGDHAADKKLFRLARQEYQDALAGDPDNAKARKFLGYKKFADAWARDEQAVVKTADGAPANQWEGLIKAFRAKFDPRAKSLAADFVRLGDWCRSVELAEEADRAYRRGVAWDGTNADARKWLGHEKEGENWLSKEALAERNALRDRVASAPKGEPWDPAETRIEKALGVKMAKALSDHFEAYAVYDAESLSKAIQVGEVAYVECVRRLGLPEDGAYLPGRITLAIVDTAAQHAAYVEAFYTDPQEREEMKGLGGTVGRGRMEHRGTANVGQRVAHNTAHIVVREACGEMEKVWLAEALANMVTAELFDKSAIYCVGRSTTGTRAGGWTFDDATTWRPTMRRWVETGDVPSTLEVMGIENHAALTGELGLKGWSILDFLAHARAADMKAYVEELKAGKPPEVALSNALGWDAEALDVAWRKYVLENY